MTLVPPIALRIKDTLITFDNISPHQITVIVTIHINFSENQISPKSRRLNSGVDSVFAVGCLFTLIQMRHQGCVVCDIQIPILIAIINSAVEQRINSRERREKSKKTINKITPIDIISDL